MNTFKKSFSVLSLILAGWTSVSLAATRQTSMDQSTSSTTSGSSSGSEAVMGIGVVVQRSFKVDVSECAKTYKYIYGEKTASCVVDPQDSAEWAHLLEGKTVSFDYKDSSDQKISVTLSTTAKGYVIKFERDVARNLTWSDVSDSAARLVSRLDGKPVSSIVMQAVQPQQSGSGE